MKSKFIPLLLVITMLSLSALPAMAQDAGSYDAASLEKVFPSKPPYSPYAGSKFPMRPFFGDTHLHTANSLDAGAAGCRLSPEDAYRFAKGEEVTSSTGQQAKLSRPLDFLVVTDHSDGMGFMPQVIGGAPQIMADPQGRKWHEMIQAGKGSEAAFDIVRNYSAKTISMNILPMPGTSAYGDTWQKIMHAAEEANDPGRFTAFIGFEWTAMAGGGGNNLHRNVIYRDGIEKASQVEPYTTLPPLGSINPEDLWKWMEAYEQKTGGNVLALAHNGNVSNGLMFPTVEAFGKKIDRHYVEQRAKWERLYEVTQMKGDGEAHPFLSPNDEFADYETWDKGNLDLTELKKPEMLKHEYAREALKNGLRLEAELGVNPYKFGLVGSTDSHTALTAVEENNFFGKVAPGEPNPHRLSKPFMQDPKTGATIMEWEVTSSGYAAVWATENTRESIFDAMERRETYATTGPRMIVRFFGGWDFTAEDANNRMPAKVGYTKGVPMGGDLKNAPAGKSPTFLVAALKDPIGANLDRYQIIKGWLDAEGKVHEKIYDVAWSGDRQPGADGKLPPVGNTVDVQNANWTNTIGATELIAVWKDPDFDPTQSAFYYGRVIEIPTPRWTAYDAKYFGEQAPEDVPMTTQERAYTSPIWYTPEI